MITDWNQNSQETPLKSLVSLKKLSKKAQEALFLEKELRQTNKIKILSKQNRRKMYIKGAVIYDISIFFSCPPVAVRIPPKKCLQVANPNTTITKTVDMAGGSDSGEWRVQTDLEKAASGVSGACGHSIGNHAILRIFLVKYPILLTEDG